MLTAFQQVEDQLAALHYLSGQLEQLRRAVADQRKAVDTFLNQFRAGTVAFTTVVLAEIQLIADQEADSRLECGALVRSFGLTLRPWRAALAETIDRLMSVQ